MAAPQQSVGPVRFGVYELDARAGELRKNGARIRLPEQLLQILTLLLERPGAIVTREEICQKLWPDGTFVDFDHSLNAAVMRLREALDDAADNPASSKPCPAAATASSPRSKAPPRPPRPLLPCPAADRGGPQPQRWRCSCSCRRPLRRM